MRGEEGVGFKGTKTVELEKPLHSAYIEGLLRGMHFGGLTVNLESRFDGLQSYGIILNSWPIWTLDPKSSVNFDSKSRVLILDPQ